MKYKQFLAVASIGILNAVTTMQAQSVAPFLNDLKIIHEGIRALPCDSPQLIFNRAMNLFLSDRVGYYLADFKTLSFYKNYITFNAGEGFFSVNHSMFQAQGKDEPVRSFWVVGARSNAANAFASAFSSKPFNNELGVTVQKKWVARPTTKLNNCSDKMVMDIKREVMLLQLEKEIKMAEENFIASTVLIQQGSIIDSSFEAAKVISQRDFYNGLKESYQHRFAVQQYVELAGNFRYKSVNTHWTNLSVYLPVITKRFVVAEALSTPVTNRNAYPFELALNHTRFWDNTKTGRFFLTLEAAIRLYNAAESNALESLTTDAYKNAGGVDTLQLRQRKIGVVYIGNYQNFLAPSVNAVVVYYPPDSHIGFSASLEQYFGRYKAMNWRLGIPVVLIDKAGVPAANFEFRVNFGDAANKIFPGKKMGDNISVSLTVGVPFSKIIY